MRHISIALGCVGLAVALAGCGEKAQELSGARKSDVPAWQGSSAASAYAAEGWKAGDKASWEEQMRNRSRGQNEYARVTQ